LQALFKQWIENLVRMYIAASSVQTRVCNIQSVMFTEFLWLPYLSPLLDANKVFLSGINLSLTEANQSAVQNNKQVELPEHHGMII